MKKRKVLEKLNKKFLTSAKKMLDLKGINDDEIYAKEIRSVRNLYNIVHQMEVELWMGDCFKDDYCDNKIYYPPIKNKKILEKDIEDSFCKNLSQKYQRQVKTPHGIIDILTENYIFEVKMDPTLSNLHTAYGQLKHYQQHFKNRKLAIVSNKFPKDYKNEEIELIIHEVKNK